MSAQARRVMLLTNKRLLEVHDRLLELEDLHEWTPVQTQEHEELTEEFERLSNHIKG